MWLIIGTAIALIILIKITKTSDAKRDQHSENNNNYLELESRKEEKIIHLAKGEVSTDEVFASLINLHPEGELIDFDRTLTFNYLDSQKRKSIRTVNFEKAFSAEKTYIYGFCELRTEPRMFKISGMSHIFDEKTKRLISRIDLEQLVLDSLHIIY
jgi:hypothetical protein